jgi:iron complex outermembrane receptor protein
MQPQPRRPVKLCRKLANLASTTALVGVMPVVGLVSPTTALAQDAAAEEGSFIEEIVVTARRRVERLQEVPEAVTVFTADLIERAGIQSYQDFANLTPNFSLFERFRPGSVIMTMRGIPSNPGGETPVTVVIDGVNVPGLEFINQRLVDIESIEVLRGPQGALYGRGAIAGAILINTRQPDNEFEGRAQVSYGNGSDFRIASGISGPIVEDKVFFRLSGDYVNRDGLIFDPGLGDEADTVDEVTFSGQVKTVLSENLTVDLRGRRVDGEAGGTLIEIVPDAAYLDFSILPNRDLKNVDDRTIDEWSLAVEYVTDFGTFNSVSAYSKSKSVFVGDADFTPVDIAQQLDINSMEAFNEDIRFTSPDDQRFRWIIGAFYQNRDYDGDLLVDSTPTTQVLPPGLVLARSIVMRKSEAWAVYGQANYDLQDKLELTLALRYDEDKRSVDDSLTQGEFISGNYSLLQPKTTLAYHWTDDVMVYATYGRGFRSGGFNELSVSQAFPNAKRRYPKEISDNFEVGLKSQFAGGRFVLNAAAFHIDFENQQFNFIDVQNVARGIVSFEETEIDGFEIEAVARPTAGLELSAAVGVSDGEITNFDGTGRFDGNKSPQTYSSTLNLSAQYVRPLFGNVELFGRVDYERRGEIFFSPENTLEFPATDFVNARLFFQTDTYAIGGYVKNLTDEETAVDFAPNAFGPGVHARFRNRPREYGVEARIRF